jgi:DNA-binding NtrC family response regulator
VLADSNRLGADVIAEALAQEPPPITRGPQQPDADPDRARVLAVLDACGGNQTMAAEQLGMSRRSLVYRLQSWGMTKPRRK